METNVARLSKDRGIHESHAEQIVWKEAMVASKHPLMFAQRSAGVENPFDSRLSGLPQTVQAELNKLLRRVPEINFFKPEPPNPEWKLFCSRTTDEAFKAAESAARIDHATAHSQNSIYGINIIPWLSEKESSGYWRALQVAKEAKRGYEWELVRKITEYFIRETISYQNHKSGWNAANSIGEILALTVISDLEYDGKEELLKGASSASRIWVRGWGLASMYNDVPYVYAEITAAAKSMYDYHV